MASSVCLVVAVSLRSFFEHDLSSLYSYYSKQWCPVFVIDYCVASVLLVSRVLVFTQNYPQSAITWLPTRRYRHDTSCPLLTSGWLTCRIATLDWVSASLYELRVSRLDWTHRIQDPWSTLQYSSYLWLLWYKVIHAGFLVFTMYHLLLVGLIWLFWLSTSPLAYLHWFVCVSFSWPLGVEIGL